MDGAKKASSERYVVEWLAGNVGSRASEAGSIRYFGLGGRPKEKTGIFSR